MVEQWTENPCVPGSIPGGTTYTHSTEWVFCFYIFAQLILPKPFILIINNHLHFKGKNVFMEIWVTIKSYGTSEGTYTIENVRWLYGSTANRFSIVKKLLKISGFCIDIASSKKTD